MRFGRSFRSSDAAPDHAIPRQKSDRRDSGSMPRLCKPCADGDHKMLHERGSGCLRQADAAGHACSCMEGK